MGWAHCADGKQIRSWFEKVTPANSRGSVAQCKPCFPPLTDVASKPACSALCVDLPQALSSRRPHMDLLQTQIELRAHAWSSNHRAGRVHALRCKPSCKVLSWALHSALQACARIGGASITLLFPYATADRDPEQVRGRQKPHTRMHSRCRLSAQLPPWYCRTPAVPDVCC